MKTAWHDATKTSFSQIFTNRFRSNFQETYQIDVKKVRQVSCCWLYALKSYWRKTGVGRFCPFLPSTARVNSTALIRMVRRPEPVWQRPMGQRKQTSRSSETTTRGAIGRPVNPARPHEAARCRGAPPAMAHLPMYQPNRQKRAELPEWNMIRKW